VLVVVGGDADVHTHAPPLRQRPQPGVLQRFPGHFQQQPLLRIERARLARRQAEVARVELAQVLAGDEAAPAADAAPGGGAVGVVPGVDRPAFRRDLGDGILAGDQQVPQRLRVVGRAGQAAAHADDRDRFVGRGRRARRCRLLRRLP